MFRSKCWKFIIILLTVRCEIYVHTSQIQGEHGCKRLLIYFKVDPLRPSSQFSVDYTGFKTDRNKQRGKFQDNFEVHEDESWDTQLAKAGRPLLTWWKYSATTQLCTLGFRGGRTRHTQWLKKDKVENFLFPVAVVQCNKDVPFWHKLQRAEPALLSDRLMLIIPWGECTAQ